MNNQKELVKIEKEVLTVGKAASEYSITTKADFDYGEDLLHQLKEIETKLITRKQEITRPLMDSLSSVRELFRPLETAYAQAKKVVKDKMLAWQIAEEERVEAEKARISARVEKGTMKVETALNKLDAVGDAPKSTTGKTQMRSIQKLEIIEEKMIPREYCIPDREKIFTALKEGIKVPGAKIRIEKILAGR